MVNDRHPDGSTPERDPMTSILRRAALALALAAPFTLGACATTDFGVGYASNSYYDDGYGGYGYGQPGFGSGLYGGAYRSGLGGWYNDFYYPGSGVYVIDRGGRRHRWNDGQRRYWQNHMNQGRPGAGRPDGIRPGFGGRPDGVRPGFGRPGGQRPEGVRPGYGRPGRPDGIGPSRGGGREGFRRGPGRGGAQGIRQGGPRFGGSGPGGQGGRGQGRAAPTPSAN